LDCRVFADPINSAKCRSSKVVFPGPIICLAVNLYRDWLSGESNTAKGHEERVTLESVGCFGVKTDISHQVGIAVGRELTSGHVG